MADIRVDSQGFSIGRWYFPPFTLRGGESVTIRLPPKALVDEDRITRCLTGVECVAGLKTEARIICAKPAASPTGWRRWFQAPTPFVWLKKNTSLSDDAVRFFLVEHQIDLKIPLSRLAGTPRTLLGLQAAFARRPDVIVFSMNGLDPMGVRETFRIVAEHLWQCSAIYLAWPMTCQEQIVHDFFPGSAEVTVIDNRHPSFA
jgi:hypothetical protein